MLPKKISTINNYTKGIGLGNGSFFWSQGLDIETTPPYLRLAPKFFKESDSSALVDLLACYWGVIFNSNNYTVNKTDGKFFIYTAGAWSLAGHTNAQAYGGLGLFADDDFMYYASNGYSGRFSIAGGWVDAWQSFAITNNANLCPITKFLKFICFGNRTNLAIWDIGASAWTAQRVILPNGYNIKWIKALSDYLVISAHHASYGSALFLWDGVSQTYNKAIRIPNITSLAGEISKGILYVITSDGWINQFTGAELKQLKQFPDMEIGDSISIDPDAIRAFNGLIHIGKASSGTYLEKRVNAGGLWVFNPMTNALYFKHILSGNQMTNVVSVRTLFLSPDLGALRVFWSDGSVYYLDISNSSGSLQPYPYGMVYISNLIEDEPYRRKRFNQLISNFYKPLPNNASAKIILKQSTTEVQQKGVVSATAGTNNTFTLSSIPSYMAVGDEIVVLQGSGAGQIRHITAIDTTTKIITVDENLADSANFSSTSRIMITPFQKIGEIVGNVDISAVNKMLRFNARAKKIQIKIEFRTLAGSTGQWDLGLAELSLVYIPDRIVK